MLHVSRTWSYQNNRDPYKLRNILIFFIWLPWCRCVSSWAWHALTLCWRVPPWCWRAPPWCMWGHYGAGTRGDGAWLWWCCTILLRLWIGTRKVQPPVQNMTSLSYVNVQLREIKTWITRLVNDIFSCGKNHKVSWIYIIMVEEYEEIVIFFECLFIIAGVWVLRDCSASGPTSPCTDLTNFRFIVLSRKVGG